MACHASINAMRGLDSSLYFCTEVSCGGLASSHIQGAAAEANEEAKLLVITIIHSWGIGLVVLPGWVQSLDWTTGLDCWTIGLDYWTCPNCKTHHFVQCRTEAKLSLRYFTNSAPTGQRSRAYLISFTFGGGYSLAWPDSIPHAN